MKSALRQSAILYIVLIASLMGQISIGDYMGIQSDILNEKRVLLVHLPDSYNDEDALYPVLYLLDGDAYFNYITSYIEYQEDLGILPPMIVVGLRNTDRTRDFTPTEIDNEPTAGGADRFINFLEIELIPAIEENFKAAPYRILFGHSLGGLFSLYVLQTKPELFKSYLVISPGFNYDDNYIIGYRPPKGTRLENKTDLFLAFGDSESSLLSPLRKYEQFIQRVYTYNLNLEVKIIKNADHGTVIPPALSAGISTIYPTWKFPARDIVGGVQAIERHFNTLSEKYGYKIIPPEEAVNDIGYALLEKGYFSRAISVFKYNMELYPESPNVYDSLGEVYMKMNQFELAQNNFEIAIKKGQETNDPNLLVFERHLQRCMELSDD